VMIIGTIGTIT